MPKGVENPTIILTTSGLRIYFDDTSGPSIHINANGDVWRDGAGMKQKGTKLTNIKR